MVLSMKCGAHFVIPKSGSRCNLKVASCKFKKWAQIIPKSRPHILVFKGGPHAIYKDGPHEFLKVDTGPT